MLLLLLFAGDGVLTFTFSDTLTSADEFAASLLLLLPDVGPMIVTMLFGVSGNWILLVGKSTTEVGLSFPCNEFWVSAGGEE